MIRSACFIGLAVAVIGCGNGDSGSPPGFVVDTAAGVPRWVYGDADVADTVTLVASIGGEDIGSISSAIASADKIFVADGHALRIGIYSHAGDLLEWVGRRGQGPGEYRSLNSLAFMGATVMGLDGRSAHITLTTPDGDHIGAWPWLPLSGPVSTVRFYPATQNEVFVLGLGSGPGPTFIRLASNGPADTLSFQLPQFSNAATLQCPRPDEGISFYSTPFAPGRIVAPAPGGLLASAISDSYRVVFTRPAGDTARILERDHIPVVVQDSEWEAETAEFREFQKAWPGVRCSPAGMNRPSVHPALKGLYFDDMGGLVVEVTSSTGTRYDFYSADGTSLETVIAPSRDPTVPPHFAGPIIVQVEKDSLDVQVVRVYRRNGR